MSAEIDFLASCRRGDLLRTRDRRQARVVSVSLADRMITGEVEMHGPCVWHGDGRWRDAPFGAAGPLDLVSPALLPDNATGEQRRASIQEALGEDNRLYCCD